MDRKTEAEKLRKDAEWHVIIAQKLIAMADAMDPPARMFGWGPPRRTICRTCGTEYSGIEYFPGCACETQGCEGFLKSKDEPVLQRGVEQEITVDELAAGMATATIASTYRGRRG